MKEYTELAKKMALEIISIWPEAGNRDFESFGKTTTVPVSGALKNAMEDGVNVDIDELRLLDQLLRAAGKEGRVNSEREQFEAAQFATFSVNYRPQLDSFRSTEFPEGQEFVYIAGSLVMESMPGRGTVDPAAARRFSKAEIIQERRLGFPPPVTGKIFQSQMSFIRVEDVEHFRSRPEEFWRWSLIPSDPVPVEEFTKDNVSRWITASEERDAQSFLSISPVPKQS